MIWLVASWHKIVIALIALDRIWDRGWQLWERFKPLEEFVERRIHERRTAPMNIPVLSQLISLIEKLFETHAPEIVAAASSPAVQQAAETTVVAAVTQDPKVQAGIAAYKAIQEFKTAISAPPAA